MIRLALVVIVVSFVLMGCATFNGIVKNNELIMQLATEATTARVINEHPDWKTPAINITDFAIAAISTKTVVSIGDVESIVKSRIPWNKLAPEEQALISALISEARRGIEDSLRGQGIRTPENEMVEISKMLRWINESAKRQ